MNKKIVLIIITIIILLILFLMHSVSYGTPWNKIKAKKEINKYLMDRYGDKMVINDLHYNLKSFDGDSGTYTAFCYKIDEQDIKFTVLYYYGVLVDDYLSSKWEQDIENKFATIINDDGISFKVRIDYYNQEFNDKSKKYGYNRPDAFSIQEDIWEWLDITVIFNYNYMGTDENNENVLEILNILKENIKFKKLIINHKNSYRSFNNQKIEQLQTLEDIANALAR